MPTDSSSRPALLVSSCLLGQPVRYDGQAKAQPEPVLAMLARHFDLIPVCPESLGGLPTPRPPAEIVGGSGAHVLAGAAIVRDATGADVTQPFTAGARDALAIARQRQCKHALLKALSPSCGNREHYDGSFSGAVRPGQGVAAALLAEAGVRVWNENEIEALIRTAGVLPAAMQNP
ncbi:hypothetical protein CF70_008095 [Cupriavidus sp. SK-3]|uniref:DUF523 domain-containing protein n=1 Tax=Cupriavidus sp. SK-3 TaxID=1470558 RepID=UPI0004484EF1|nr:DUF523 domain-containing protein [Cupriavidus sp. SK-3]KDP86315.1 hypothetical protein CF70_008095 [Cupriavidus sp. SK-3]